MIDGRCQNIVDIKRQVQEFMDAKKERDELIEILRLLLPFIDAPQCAPYKAQLLLAKEYIARLDAEKEKP